MSNIISTGEVADDWTIVQSLISTYMDAHNDLAALHLQMQFDASGHFEMCATPDTPQWVRDAFVS